jgi:acetylornithine deacetylase ArgE
MGMTAEAILAELVKIESVNPRFDANARGEVAVAAWVRQFCEHHGLDHEVQPVEGERANILAWVTGREADTRVLFEAHMDTMPAPGWTKDPFGAEREGSRLYGRGACDTKASLAAMLRALVTVRDSRFRATAVVAAAIDEEGVKAGARALANSGVRYEAAVIGEPTDLAPVLAHNGSVRWRIETRGRAAHTSKPHTGINAVTKMARVVCALQERIPPKLVRHVHPLVGTPTLTISMIEGGIDLCIVPDRCTIGIDRRLVPGETAREALAEVEAILADLRAKDSELDVRSLPAVEDPPVEAPAASRIAQVATKACADVAGTGEPRGVPYGTDASQLAPRGITCIVLGPGSIEQAHTTSEYVELPQLEAAVDIYRRIMLSY